MNLAFGLKKKENLPTFQLNNTRHRLKLLKITPISKKCKMNHLKLLKTLFLVIKKIEIMSRFLCGPQTGNRCSDLKSCQLEHKRNNETSLHFQISHH